jgi:F-type H+-transporting ATPase subunit j
MFGLRKWSTPVLRPAAPFIAGGAAVFYLIAKAQSAMINSKSISTRLLQYS